MKVLTVSLNCRNKRLRFTSILSCVISCHMPGKTNLNMMKLTTSATILISGIMTTFMTSRLFLRYPSRKSLRIFGKDTGALMS